MLAAAVAEFAEAGYHAAGQTAIARRAGISQPYVYALYRHKQELFLAAHRRVAERIRARLVAAAEGASEPEDALRAMGEAYLRLLADRGRPLPAPGRRRGGRSGPGAPGARRVPPGLRVRPRGSGISREETAFFLAGAIFLAIGGALDIPPGVLGRRRAAGRLIALSIVRRQTGRDPESARTPAQSCR